MYHVNNSVDSVGRLYKVRRYITSNTFNMYTE